MALGATLTTTVIMAICLIASIIFVFTIPSFKESNTGSVLGYISIGALVLAIISIIIMIVIYVQEEKYPTREDLFPVLKD